MKKRVRKRTDDVGCDESGEGVLGEENEKFGKRRVDELDDCVDGDEYDGVRRLLSKWYDCLCSRRRSHPHLLLVLGPPIGPPLSDRPTPRSRILHQSLPSFPNCSSLWHEKGRSRPRPS
jgi:hypothetical protein